MTDGYRVEVRDSVRRKFAKIPKDDLARIISRIEKLSADPRPPGCQKLANEEGYRVRQGDYRILYTVDDEERVVNVYLVSHRREAYR